MNHLNMLTRFPEAGTTKTRMIPALGADGAADLQRQLTEHIVSNLIRGPVDTAPFELTIWHKGGSSARMKTWLGETIDYRAQTGDSLARIILNAFNHSFSRGAQKTVVIGSDCPGINLDLIESAFHGLEKNDLILGPAADGGYYLIGLKNGVQHAAMLLDENLAWGKKELYSQVLDTAEHAGIRTQSLTVLNDIDTPDDLVHFHHYTGKK